MPKYRVEMADGRVFQVEADQPPSEAEILSHLDSAPSGPSAQAVGDDEPDTYAGGFMRSLGQTAKDTASAAGRGFVKALDPRPLLNAAREYDGGKSWFDQTEQGTRPTMRDQLGTLKTGAQSLTTPEGGGEAIGMLGANLLIPRGASMAGRGARAAAPKVMDAGLWRSGADRIDFPGTPQRLVDEGIRPGGGRVQRALSATEQGVNDSATAFDAARTSPGAMPRGTVDPQNLAAEARVFAGQKGRVGGLGDLPGPEDARLDSARGDYLRTNTRPRTQAETIEQKRSYQARASYSNRANAPTVTNEQTNFDTGIADANRRAAIKNQPGLEDALRKEQDLLGALLAEQKTGNRGVPLTLPGVARSLLMNKQVLGAGAIGMDRTGRALQQVEAIRSALLALMASHEREDE